jgi:hypothetical protein
MTPQDERERQQREASEQGAFREKTHKAQVSHHIEDQPPLVIVIPDARLCCPGCFWARQALDAQSLKLLNDATV